MRRQREGAITFSSSVRTTSVSWYLEEHSATSFYQSSNQLPVRLYFPSGGQIRGSKSLGTFEKQCSVSMCDSVPILAEVRRALPANRVIMVLENYGAGPQDSVEVHEGLREIRKGERGNARMK